MQGNRASAKNNASRNGVDGITHLAARDIFATIAADPQHSYAVRVSFLEIYNEEVRDLLAAADGKSGAASAGGQRQQATLAVREDPKAGVFVENLTSHRVYNLDTLLHYLNLGAMLSSGVIKGYVPPVSFAVVTMIATLVIVGGARVLFAFAEDFFVEMVN